MYFLKIFSLCVSLLLVLCSCSVHGQPYFFKVTDFGAIADGKIDNSAAFMTTWEKACSTNGGAVLVPPGTFLVKGASFGGPCNGATFFQLNGNLVAAPGPSFGQQFWIQFRQIDGLKILGSGTFDGQGASAWAHNTPDSSNRSLPPVSIMIIQVTNSVLRDIRSLNSKGFHFHIARCERLVVKNIDIIAPEDSPNTDGIHIGNSKGVKVIKSRISTGDDCVSIGDGNTNITINRVRCGPGHGISIGSLGKYKQEENVRGIIVKNCTFTNTDNGLRIKTWAPSTTPLTLSDVVFFDIVVNNVQNPIIIDQYYCPRAPCSHSGESDVAINGVKFINVRGSSTTPVAVNLQCSKLRPCKDIVLSGLDLKMAGTRQPTTASCLNADTNFVGNSQIPAKC